MEKCADDFFKNIKAISLKFFCGHSLYIELTCFEVSVTLSQHLIKLHGGPLVCCKFSFLHLVHERNNISHFLKQLSLNNHKTSKRWLRK